MPNKEGATPSGRVSKGCHGSISKKLSHPHAAESAKTDGATSEISSDVPQSLQLIFNGGNK